MGDRAARLFEYISEIVYIWTRAGRFIDLHKCVVYVNLFEWKSVFSLTSADAPL